MSDANREADAAAIGAVERWPVDRATGAVVRPGAEPVVAGDPDAVFALASVTKLLSALAVLVAVEEGVVALDEPAGPPGSTLRHLLAHASGLGYDTADGISAPPGTRRIYSNAGFEALADRLAAAAGIGFATYLSEAVLEPLGMTATALHGSPAHGATSTIGDVARLADELLVPTLVAPETLAAAVQPAFAELAGVLPGFGLQDPNPWGLGFEVRGTKSPHWTGARNSSTTFGHFGRSGTFLWVDPTAAVACVALTDREFGPWAQTAWPALSDAVLDATTPGAAAPP